MNTQFNPKWEAIYQKIYDNEDVGYREVAMKAISEIVELEKQKVIDQLTEIQLQSNIRHQEQLDKEDTEITHLEHVIKQMDDDYVMEIEGKCAEIATESARLENQLTYMRLERDIYFDELHEKRVKIAELESELSAARKEIEELKIQLQDEFTYGYDYCKHYYKINDL